MEISITNFGSLAVKINIDLKGIDSGISNDVVSSIANGMYTFLCLARSAVQLITFDQNQDSMKETVLF